MATFFQNSIAPLGSFIPGYFFMYSATLAAIKDALSLACRAFRVDCLLYCIPVHHAQ